MSKCFEKVKNHNEEDLSIFKLFCGLHAAVKQMHTLGVKKNFVDFFPIRFLLWHSWL
jgi:hypothetical protein